MPNWVEKSFCLVKKGGYLDQLISVYPPPPSKPRSLSQKDMEFIKLAFKEKGDFNFLKTLLALKKFPFNDPYVSFLRETPEEIRNNPVTTKRICNRLREMGVNKVIARLKEPKEFNRQMGAMFNIWLTKKYPFVTDFEEFKSAKKSPVFLGGSGEKLRQFANMNGCGIQKQPDFVAKVKSRIIIGEAKFIGTEGGNQNRAFDDALKLASSSFKHATAVAVLDGIIWIPESGQMSRRLKNFSGNALTALLLDKFFDSL